VEGMTGWGGGPREGPGQHLVDKRGVFPPTGEIQGRIERESIGARICGLVQNSREASVIVTNDGRGVGSLVEERYLQFAIVHCLGVTGPGQCKVSAGGECDATNSGGG